ncbi:MAG: hypothetical protein ABI550_01050 [Ignavibacteriaceae bacterium]
MIKYLSSSKENSSNLKDNPPARSNYDNVEEAEFKEIEPDKNEQNDNS